MIKRAMSIGREYRANRHACGVRGGARAGSVHCVPRFAHCLSQRVRRAGTASFVGVMRRAGRSLALVVLLSCMLLSQSLHALIVIEDLSNLAQNIIIARESIKQVTLMKNQLKSLTDLKGALKVLGVPELRDLEGLLGFDVFGDDVDEALGQSLRDILKNQEDSMEFARSALLGWEALSPEERAEVLSYVESEQKRAQDELKSIHSSLGDYRNQIRELLASSGSQNASILLVAQNIMGGVAILSKQLDELIMLQTFEQRRAMRELEVEKWQEERAKKETPVLLSPEEFAELNSATPMRALPDIGASRMGVGGRL